MAPALPLGLITLATKPKVKPRLTTQTHLCLWWLSVNFKFKLFKLSWKWGNELDSLLLYSDVQSVCGFSCEDIASMFKELKGLGVVIKQLSNELRKVVSSKGHWGLLFVIIHSLFSSPLRLFLWFQLMHSQCVATCRCNGSPGPSP